MFGSVDFVEELEIIVTFVEGEGFLVVEMGFVVVWIGFIVSVV